MSRAEQMQVKSGDWSEVHRRLENVQKSLERGLAPSREQKLRILKSRAEAFSREPTVRDAGQLLEVVTFQLSTETYAFESRWVREILALRELQRLPWNPTFVAGIVNVRGKIMAVIDIKKVFDLPDVEDGEKGRVLVIQSGELELGILADQILGVDALERNDLQKSLPAFAGVRQEFLAGVTARGMVLLDAERILLANFAVQG